MLSPGSELVWFDPAGLFNAGVKFLALGLVFHAREAILLEKHGQPASFFITAAAVVKYIIPPIVVEQILQDRTAKQVLHLITGQARCQLAQAGAAERVSLAKVGFVNETSAEQDAKRQGQQEKWSFHKGPRSF